MHLLPPPLSGRGTQPPSPGPSRSGLSSGSVGHSALELLFSSGQHLKSAVSGSSAPGHDVCFTAFWRVSFAQFWLSAECNWECVLHVCQRTEQTSSHRGISLGGSEEYESELSCSVVSDSL